MEKASNRLNLSQKREMFSIANRQTLMNSNIQKKRDGTSEHLILTEKVKNMDMILVFENLIRGNHSPSHFFNLLVELRKMSSCDNFFIPNEVLSVNFSYFFAELLARLDTNIVYEASWCMINFYMEKNFMYSDNLEVFLTLEKLITNAGTPVLIHVFRILLHICSYKEGAILVLDRLNFNDVEKVLKTDSTLAIPFFKFSTELINMHPSIDYFNVSLIILITLRILDYDFDSKKHSGDLTWGIRTIDAFLCKMQSLEELDENVKELVNIGFYDCIFKIGLRTFDKPTYSEKIVNDAIVNVLITTSLVEDDMIIHNLFNKCPEFFQLLAQNIIDKETTILKSPIFRFYNNLMIMDNNYCVYLSKSGLYMAMIEILTVPGIAKMSTLLNALETFYSLASNKLLDSVHEDIMGDLFSLLKRNDIIFESCKLIFGIMNFIISRDLNSYEIREEIKNNGDYQQALEEYFDCYEDDMDDAQLNDFVKSITCDSGY